MKQFCTLHKDTKVVVYRKTHTELSTIVKADVGRMFTVTNIEHAGRKHNKFVAYVYLRGSGGEERRACVDELARCNPNFEPEGEYIVCVGCGATMSDSDLKSLKGLPNIKTCPSCGMLEPTVS